MDETKLSKKSNQALFYSKRFGYSAYRYFWSCIDFLFPPICGGCEKKGVRWCPICASKIKLIVQPFCPICGQPQQSRNICDRCRSYKPNYHRLRSWAIFSGGLRNAIHKLKYHRDIPLAEILSRPLIDMLIRLNWAIDQVVPVPLADDRQESRGYNQAALIAIPIALRLDLSYQPKALMRIRETESQIGLSLIQRQNNVSGAFVSNNKIVENKSMLIIDDVVTSGATINECADALIKSGAQTVYAATLARAMYN